MSVVAAAVELARTVHGDLDRCAGPMIGTGEMGRCWPAACARRDWRG
ncbi:MAG: hypothetical protein U1E38_01885 [Rhodospirillales bacterium]